jgi:1,2-diacylglycerol 3-alpha-glucosyltransferase
LKKKKIDIIHTHTEFTVALYGKKAAKKLRLPLVQSTHTMWEEYRHYILNGKIFTRGMVRKMMSTFMKNAYCLVCPSIKAEKYYKGLLPNISTVVINNGIDVNNFKSSVITESEIVSLRKTFDFNKNEKILLFVGRIGNEKRVLELFNIVVPILKEDNHIKMIFTGAGPLVDHISDSAKRLGLEKQVVFTGFVNWDLVYRLYSISDLFITASLSEVQPMTLIEASMCGMPMIVRRDDSYLDLVHNGKNGYIVDSDEEMTAKIKSLIHDDKKLKEFSEYSLKNSSKFTAENHVARMEKFYQEVLKSYPNKFDCKSFSQKYL